MAIVMEHRVGNAVIRVDDSEIAGCPEDVMRRRREAVCVAVGAILANPAARRALIAQYQREDEETHTA